MCSGAYVAQNPRQTSVIKNVGCAGMHAGCATKQDDKKMTETPTMPLTRQYDTQYTRRSIMHSVDRMVNVQLKPTTAKWGKRHCKQCFMPTSKNQDTLKGLCSTEPFITNNKHSDAYHGQHTRNGVT
jgi:hypothetical protein